MSMKPAEFGHKYFDSLRKRKATQTEEPDDVPIAIPKAHVRGSSTPQVTKLTSENPMGLLDALPSVGEWIQVTNGKYSGEVAQVSKVEENLGMVCAKVAQWSIRSLLPADQIDAIDKTCPQEISVPNLHHWLNHVESAHSLGTFPVHRQNFKRASRQVVLEHKAEAAQSAAPWSLGFVVRRAVRNGNQEELSKAKYITLRFFSGGWVLVCRKKHWKPEDQKNAALFTRILMDKDTLDAETVFIADIETDNEHTPIDVNSGSAEAAGFMLIHSSIIKPTLGKIGEKVAVLRSTLSDAQKEALEKIIPTAKDSNTSAPLIAKIISKDDHTEEAVFQPIERDKTTADAHISLRICDVCSFVTL